MKPKTSALLIILAMLAAASAFYLSGCAIGATNYLGDGLSKDELFPLPHQTYDLL